MCIRDSLCVERGAVSAHQSGNLRTDHIAPKLHLKRTQHRVVQKGASLHLSLIHI